MSEGGMPIVPANECPPNQDRNPFIGCEQSPSGNAPVRTNELIGGGLLPWTRFLALE